MQTPALRRVRARITRLLLLPWACILSFAVCAPAAALSFVAPTDTGLADQAEAVVIGQVSAVAADAGDELSAARYVVQVDEVLKGGRLPAMLTLRVPGALDRARAGALVVPGAPAFKLPDRVLLFLKRRADGAYGLTQFSLGVFHVRAAGARAVLIRDLTGADERDGALIAAGAPPPGQVRDLARFRLWLLARAAGRAPDADYWTDPPPVTAAPAVKFAVEGTTGVRWFEFQQGRNVTLYAGGAGQSGLPGGGYAEFQRALAAWNNDPASNVRYAYGGISGASGGLGRADGVNQILFNDPDGDLDGRFDCVNGGVIAYSGFRYGANSPLNGQLLQPLTEADIVVQDGAGCMLTGHANADATEVFTHELGHTLGLAHSCGDGLLSPSLPCIGGTPMDDAVMRPTMHSDGRGAALHLDDRAGITVLYPALAAPAPDGAPPPPPAPGGGDGTPAGSSGTPGQGGGGCFDAAALGVLLLFARRRAARRRRM